MAEFAPDLDVKLVDQDELESSLTKKANDALLSKESELDSKRLEKTTQELDKVQKKVAALESRLRNPRTKISLRRQLKDEIEWFQKNELQPLLQDVQDIQSRLDANRAQLQNGGSRARDGESERDYLIRTGKITAFGSSSGFLAANGQGTPSSVKLRAPGFLDISDTFERGDVSENSGDLLPETKMDTDLIDLGHDIIDIEEEPDMALKSEVLLDSGNTETPTIVLSDSENYSAAESEDGVSEDDDSGSQFGAELDLDTPPAKRQKTGRSSKKTSKSDSLDRKSVV